MSMDWSTESRPSITIDTNWIKEKGSVIAQAPAETVRRLKEIHTPDRVFYWGLRAIGFTVLILLLAIGVFLFSASLPAMQKFGWSFIWKNSWNPVTHEYGALPVIYGTLVSSFLALLIATPVSLGIALFLNELAPRGVASIVRFLVEMLAAIPSVVYGLWGFFVLAPFLKNTFEPAVESVVKSLPSPMAEALYPLIAGPYYGVGMFTAGLVLAIMITPTISAISREVFAAISRSQREAALALGATRWEMMKLSVLRSSKAGIAGALVLGLGRALGETMAVTMVIGNSFAISTSIFAPAQTMASVIANEYAEATEALHVAALAQIGLTLFAVTFVVNSIARFLVWRVTRVPGAKGAMK